MDCVLYEAHLRQQHTDYDARCRRCGACCGVDNDPCENLLSEPGGTYACRIYHSRLGTQRTISGKTFTCVPIRDNIARGFSDPACTYTKQRNPV